MKIKYLSYQQAAAITSEHQHLTGEPFGEGPDASRRVDAVVLAPYSRILQWSFARQVVKGMHPSEALKQWPVDRFDVVVISANPANPADFQVKGLRDYLSERGMEFKQMGYRRVAA
jgi:hypothetical protein